MQKFFKHFNIRTFIRVSLYVFIFTVAQTASAATLYLNPSSVQLSTGETAKIRVLVNTKGQSINAVEGLIKYDPSTVDVTAVSKLNSILNIWIEEPAISSAGGSISFNGGVINPGYTGGAGEVFYFMIKAKKTGAANFTFSDTTVRASDGEGTDVLTSETGTTVTINKGAANTPVTSEPAKPALKPASEPAQKPKVKLVAPELSSPTHPDQQTWYPLRSADVVWPRDVKAAGVQVVFNSNPTTIASGPVQYGLTKKMLRGVRDGVSYLHVRYVGQNTVSETAHYAIRVDTIAPSDISIATSTVDEGTVIEIMAKDEHSGLAYAEVSLDGGEAKKVDSFDGRLIFKPDAGVESGNHIARIVVYDKAGNNAELQSVVTITVPKIEVVEPVVIPPVIEKENVLVKMYNWLVDNCTILALIAAILASFAAVVFSITCARNRKKCSIDVNALEQEAGRSADILKEEAYKQIVYLERIAQLRDLTLAEKNIYNKCRMLLK